MPDNEALAASAMKAFEHVVAAAGDFSHRPGQHQMALEVSRAFSQATLGEDAQPTRRIAVIQAGTGVGKSLAACVPAMAIALARNTRVIISTATVALQEQLVNKDLPRFVELLGDHVGQTVTVALAKGRGRYVCHTKLKRAAGGEADPHADLFEDESPVASAVAKDTQAHQMVVLQGLAKQLHRSWSGELDTLPVPQAEVDWSSIAADRSTCTARHCPDFGSCVYYQARKQLATAQVIVANHDLLMASMGANVLPDISNSLLVLDEAHELPQVASSQFAASMDLSSLRWTDQLAKRIQKVGTELRYDSTAQAITLCRDVRQALSDLQTVTMDLWGLDALKKGAPERLPFGVLPEVLIEPMRLTSGLAQALAAHMKSMSDMLSKQIKESPEQAPRLSSMYAALGALSPRLDGVVDTTRLMLANTEDATPDAKWFEFDDERGLVRITAHASPLMAGPLLASYVWPRVRGAVVTSATITSCGRFDYFLSEAGLRADEAVSTLEVQSPFDFAQQATLRVHRTMAEPREVSAYNAEVSQAIAQDLSALERGALVLFTSKAHLSQAVSALPDALRDRVLVQGDASRIEILRRHKQRVDEGQPSVIFGLQSFGQGVDLPGAYCETVMVAKLPFTPPTDPVGQARAEWLQSLGRDAFTELVVPATSIKLNQWVGRLIRTEQDRGQVICYDKRLSDTAYGRRILQGLPAFKRV